MSCTSTVVYDGYLWCCSMTTTLPHTDHMTDLPVEYADNGRRWFTKACQDHGNRWSIVYRDRNLVTPRRPAYVYDAC